MQATIPPAAARQTGAQAGRRGRRGRPGALLTPAPVGDQARGRGEGGGRRPGLVHLPARGAQQRLCPSEGRSHGGGISGGFQAGSAGGIGGGGALAVSVRLFLFR